MLTPNLPARSSPMTNMSMPNLPTSNMPSTNLPTSNMSSPNLPTSIMSTPSLPTENMSNQNMSTLNQSELMPPPLTPINSPREPDTKTDLTVVKSDCSEVFGENNVDVGGLAIALPHGSLMFECA